MDSRSFFLLGSRVFFGVWLLYIGIGKILNGPTNFVAYLLTEFATVWPPAYLITILAWIILIAEPVLGFLLLLGKKSRCVWTLAAMLMFTLMFGQTLLMKFDGVASNWIYCIFCLACAALSNPESWACCSEKTEKTGCCS